MMEHLLLKRGSKMKKITTLITVLCMGLLLCGCMDAEDTTKCKHKGCKSDIASTGSTLYCEEHSETCGRCGMYINEDESLCYNCAKATAKSSSSGSSKSSSGTKSSGSSKSDYDYDKGYGYTAPKKDESFSDYVKRQDPELYENMKDAYENAK